MYVDLKQLKSLSHLKKNLQEDEREKKIIKEEMEFEREEHFKPITENLKELQKNIVQHQLQPLTMLTQPILPALTPSTPGMQSILTQAPQQQAITSQSTPNSSSTYYGKLADKYLKTPAIKYDHAFGLKPVEGSSMWRLGKMDVKITGNDLEVDNNKYKGTEGLWQLLTLKQPTNYTDDDFQMYKKMVLKTKAFLNEQQDRVKSNRGNKFKMLIKPIADEWKQNQSATLSHSAPTSPFLSRRQSVTFGSPEDPLASLTNQMQNISIVQDDDEAAQGATGSGSGVVFLPSDPNELLDRHRLLFGAWNSGNTGVFNEINAINDKLLEMGIFDTDMIRDLWSVTSKAR